MMLFEIFLFVAFIVLVVWTIRGKIQQQQQQHLDEGGDDDNDPLPPVYIPSLPGFVDTNRYSIVSSRWLVGWLVTLFVAVTCRLHAAVFVERRRVSVVS